MSFLLLNLLISLIFIGLASLLIGLFVLLKSNKSQVNKIFALYSFSIAVWAIFQLIANTSNDHSTAYFLEKITISVVWFIPTFFVHFTILFLELRNKKLLVHIGYGISAVLAFVSIVTSKVVAGTTAILFLKYWIVPGPVYHIGFVYFIAAVAYSLYELFKAYGNSRGKRRNQIGYVVWPSLLGYIGGAGNLLYSYDIYIPILMPFGTYFISFYVISIAYAICKYQLMDIRVVVQRTLFYSIGISIASGVIIGISFVSSWISKSIPGFQVWIIPIITGIAAFSIGNMFYRKSKEVENAYEVEKKAHRELARLTEVKDEFILSTQHHLRTPLSIMKGYLSLMEKMVDEKKTSKEDMKEYLDKTVVSTERLVKIVNELLDITQLKAGKKPFHMQSVHVYRIIHSITRELKEEIEKKNLTVQIIPEKGWPTIQADAERIRIALFNLIDNAVKYTERGAIIIKGQKLGGVFRIIIKDTGMGMDPQEAKIIFTKYFERGRNAHKLHATGRGIGLYITDSIIKMHKGRTHAKSDGKNKGSEFIVELPIESN
ncbi:ATP-binding protein [Patescibacteria group bacterium]